MPSFQCSLRIAGNVPVCLLGGVIVTHIYKQFRDRYPDGYLLHILYRYGFVALFTSSRTMINPFIRRFYL